MRKRSQYSRRQLGHKLTIWLCIAASVSVLAGKVWAADEPENSANARLLQQWAASCALCHVDGTGGAPRLGVAEEWLPRISKGPSVLLQHTLEGFNNMPPLGYCMSCDTRDFADLIAFMTEGMASNGESTQTGSQP